MTGASQIRFPPGSGNVEIVDHDQCKEGCTC